MTTPAPPSGGAGSRLLGTNALQPIIDKFSTAVDKLGTIVSQMGTPGPGGTTTTGFRGTAQTFTAGSFPKMQPPAFSSGANYATAPGGMTSTNANGGGLGSAAQAYGSSIASTVANYGTSQFGNQVTMNQYASMSMLGAAPGKSIGSGFTALYGQAFGNWNTNLNAIANSPADAAQMYSNLQGIAASPFVGSTALGRSGMGASSAFGYANPAMGGAGASAAAAQLYSGQTSMSFRQLGYGMTPRAAGGVGSPTQMGQLVQGMMQKWYGKSSVSANTLNAGLANNGKVQLNLQALGLDPNTMGPALQMYNKLFQQGVGASQANTMLNDAAHNSNYGGTSAQKLLSNKYGIATSDLQKLKDTQAVKTGETSGESSAFNSALSQSTTSLQRFDKAINSILKVTGLGGVLGFASGMSGAEGAIGGVLSKGVGMISRFGGAGAITAASASPINAGAQSNGASAGSSTSGMSKSVGRAIKDAEAQVGHPYVWGGDNPSVGFDCSGLIEWAYSQAGVKLPRTSQEQWAALQNRSVSLGSVRAGDIVFQAGSDGSANAPGHEAMMISDKQIVEAPYTGANIRIRAYNPSEWQHAGRPTGSTSGGATSGTNGVGTPATTTGTGNSGSGTGKGGLGLSVGNYGSSSELSNLSAALLGSGLTGGGMGGGGSVGNGQGSGASTTASVSTAGGGSASANEALVKKMAQQMYGWGGRQWTNGLKPLLTQESGFRSNAQNPTSTAYGMFQFLDTTWGPYGPKTSNPGLQSKYGLEYVHDRYGDPLNAEAHERANNWYSGGTKSTRGGLALVGERGPELVKLGGGQQVMNASQTADILKGTMAKPGAGLWDNHTAQALSLAPIPQNFTQGRASGKCEVHLNFPPNAIVIHTNGTAADVSSSVRQIMDGITQQMEENSTIQKIMAGVTG